MAEHWTHLRTTNVIEAPFATVRLRQRVTKGAGSRTKGLLMAYKLLDMAAASKESTRASFKRAGAVEVMTGVDISQAMIALAEVDEREDPTGLPVHPRGRGGRRRPSTS